MEYSKESIERQEKINELKKAWVIVYANHFYWKQDIKKIKNEKWKIKDVSKLMEEWAVWEFKTAGRLMLLRSMWKLIFANIQDNTWSIQICFMKQKVKFNTWKELVDSLQLDSWEKTAHKLAEKYLLAGDYIWVTWDLFFTKHWEITLFVKDFQILSKAVRPLPEKFHWLSDKETIYKQRYLDLIMNEDSYNRMLFRSKVIKLLRKFYEKEGFIEVETPILWNAASGAAAKPFITHHNDFNEDFYLRIAPETALKKATVWRFEKIFEIGKNFRNEGTDPTHMQEFTTLEHYAAWRNFEDNMAFTEKMFDYLFDNLWIDRKINVIDKEGNSKIVDFTTPWKKIDYIQWVKEKSWIDVSKYTEEDIDKLKNDIKEKWIKIEWIENMWVATMIDYLYKKVLRPSIVWPAFVYNYPKTMQPLARTSDKNEKIVEQFQLVVNGVELNKAYSELVDPQIQKENFQAQLKAIEKWDEEAISWDDDFLLAMEYGMPPQSWWGMWIDRLVALLTEQSNLRDVVLFPVMKSWNKKDNKKK